ncbi:MAG TPA: ABC transporter permease [Gemmataceae bacterium]|nr:ABC transporter permease [Gemmataceae bacterium]
MRLADILWLSLSALYQQKLRTLLTSLGVLSGGFVLVFSVSMGWGVQETIVREYSKYAGLRQIDVSPSYGAPPATEAEDKVDVKGEMSPEKRKRLRHEIYRRDHQNVVQSAKTKLTPEVLQRLREIPHVKSVTPEIYLNGRAIFQKKADDAFAHSAPPESKNLRARVVAGSFLDSTDGDAAVVSEYLLYHLGITDESAIQAVLGRTLRVEYRTGVNKSYFLRMLFNLGEDKVAAEDQDLFDKVLKQLPRALDKLDLKPAERDSLRKALKPSAASPRAEEKIFARDFTIAGVLRGPAKEDPRGYREWWAENVDVVLPVQTATDFFFEVSANREGGVPRALVETDSLDNVKEVTLAIRDLGLETTSLLELIEREQFIYLLLFAAMSCIAIVALMVAAIGIVNTMLMSVLERTREIGVMKAVGARHGQIQAIFLLEGALIGLTGGLLGLLVGWALSLPADSWARSLVSSRMKLDLQGSLFVWPAWLLVGAPLFAALVTTLAAVYPARRAARVNPITALRHE